MVEVKIVYSKIIKGEVEKYIYHDVEVSGHANSGNMTSIKCCAGITAVLFGFAKMVTGIGESVVLDKGYFKYKCYEGCERKNKATQYAMNCVVHQLYEIYRCYPSLFKDFEFVERGNY